jgi:hypothetical protein
MSGLPLIGRRSRAWKWQRYAVILGSIVLAAVAAQRSSVRTMGLVLTVPVLLILLQDLRWALLLLPVLSAFVPLNVGTGTSVSLNATTIAVPGLAVAWVARQALGRGFHWVSSRLDRPLIALLSITVLSLLSGTASWDPSVPRPSNLTSVQVGQVSIYVFSFVALWLTANLVADLKWLRRLAYGFVSAIGVALVLSIARVSTAIVPLLSGIWMVSLSLGLALYDTGLSTGQRNLLLLIGIVGPLALRMMNQQWAALWVPPIVAAATVLWLHSSESRRLLMVGIVLVLAFVGVSGLLRAVNWEVEWQTSGASRLTLWGSVVGLVSSRPLLGLGPAAYRHYHLLKPLAYGGALWLSPRVSAHNQFVDLFAQVGVLGLACYVWFLIEVARSAWQLYSQSDGFAKGYALAVLAAEAGVLVADMFAASSLPFVYNNGFGGFRGSALHWMLLGGLVVLENLRSREQAGAKEHA